MFPFIALCMDFLIPPLFVCISQHGRVSLIVICYHPLSSSWINSLCANIQAVERSGLFVQSDAFRLWMQVAAVNLVPSQFS